MTSRTLVSDRLQGIILAIVILSGIALFAASTNFNSLYEEFLSANFDSVHGARTLLKAQFFLRQAADKLEDSRIDGVDALTFRDQAVGDLLLAANYGAEGSDSTSVTRADLVGRILRLQAELGDLRSSSANDSDAELHAMIVEILAMADSLSVAELEGWGTLSSLNAELAKKMGQLRLFIGAISVIFIVIMAALARSLFRTRRAEAALKKAKAETEAIQQTTLDASTMGIIYVAQGDSDEPRIIAANRRMTEIFGYPANELVGLEASRIYGDIASCQRAPAKFAALAAGGVVREELRMRRSDGTRFWCAVSSKAIDPSDPARGVVCTLEDISELKKASEELENARQQAEAANRAKSEFLANMSHEIRTPFTGVLGMLELLLRSRLETQQRQYAELAHSSTRQLMAIVDDILDLSQIEFGKLRIETSAFDLRSLLEGIARMHAVMADNKKLDFCFQIDADVPAWVTADAGRLRQVIDNLAGNALKFTSQGKVELHAECLVAGGGSSRLRFSVIDTGIGIAPRDQQHIFDKFTQADTSTARTYGGSGLGLAICRQLVTAMGGVIGVDSVEGQGSCFWFEVDLPHASAPEPTAAPGTASDTPAQLCGVRVLLVDDNDSNRQVIGEFLRLQGATVFEASDGEIAVGLVGEANADVILMDGQMPVCDGYEATRRIRAGEGPGRRVPIIALTAHAMEADREKCIAAGMDDYLTKPIPSELLAERVMLHLQRGTPANAANRLLAARFHGHVLLAEDDVVIQQACRGLLEHLGCRVSVAGNGHEALEMGEKEDFDLVFLDCRMPILNGWETARRWREREYARNHTPTAIIGVTASRDRDEQAVCQAAGMNGVLLKPFNDESLRVLLQAWLQRNAAESTAD